MILIRQSGEAAWRSPSTSSYADEAALQKLIAQSPTLLPGATDVPLVVAREMSVPSIGYVDVVAIGIDGSITLVECKLRANPEIRRQVLGQVLAYAAGSWGLSYEVFEAAFSNAAGRPMIDLIRARADDNWNEEAFRSAIAENLARGRFRLVIVVDAITEELKRTVQYLNEHTGTDLQILALELGYIADNGVEILVPHIYGEESTQTKSVAPRRQWDQAALFARLANFCTPDALSVVRDLFDQLKARSADWYWSEGQLPFASAQFPIADKRVSLITVGEWPANRGVVSINFEYLRGLVSRDVLQQAANLLRSIPGIASVYTQLEARDFRQRPNLPINQFLGISGALEIIIQVIDLLRTAPPITSASAGASDEAPAPPDGSDDA